MVDGSLKQHSSWKDEDGFDVTRYVADFKHPETNEIHPMVTDITYGQVEDIYGAKQYHPTMETRIYPKGYDIDDMGRDQGYEWDDYEISLLDTIAAAYFRPEADKYSDDPMRRENFGNRRLVGQPNVQGAGPVNRVGDWRSINASPGTKLSWEDYLKRYKDYKYEGHGTAMYNMAADVLHRHTRNAHRIERDNTQTEDAKRMWAKHEGKDYWPARHER